MIRYSLRCHQDHGFESWFKSAEAFEALKSAGHLTCPTCSSVEISKAIMSPQVSTSRDQTESAPVKHMRCPRQQARLRKRYRTLRKAIEENSEYVGTSFAETARKMHHGDLEHRSIHGEASRDDAKSLIDDGVPVIAPSVHAESEGRIKNSDVSPSGQEYRKAWSEAIAHKTCHFIASEWNSPVAAQMNGASVRWR